MLFMRGVKSVSRHETVGCFSHSEFDEVTANLAADDSSPGKRHSIG
jgi:hypothetical protein